MTKLKISEILKNQTITNQFDFSGSCPDKDGCTVTYTIFPTSLFINEIKYKYFNRVMFVDDPDTAFAELVAQFTTWKNARGFMYARMMYAYSLGYNPIENYSSIEHTESESSLKHGLQSQRTYNSDKVTTGHTNDKVVRTYQQEKATDKSGRYGVNSSTLVDVTENTNEMTGGHTDEYSGTKYDEHTQKDKILPALEKGEVIHFTFTPEEKETTPPKHYTIETLNNYLKNPFKEEKVQYLLFILVGGI